MESESGLRHKRELVHDCIRFAIDSIRLYGATNSDSLLERFPHRQDVLNRLNLDCLQNGGEIIPLQSYFLPAQ